MDIGSIVFWLFMAVCVWALIYKSTKKSGGRPAQSPTPPVKPVRPNSDDAEIPLSAAERAKIEERLKIERHFANMFSTISKPQQESIIELNEKKYKCGRHDAMKHAIDDLIAENERTK